MNFLEGALVEGGVRVPGLGDLVLPTAVRAKGGKVRVGVRPEHLGLAEGAALQDRPARASGRGDLRASADRAPGSG